MSLRKMIMGGLIGLSLAACTDYVGQDEYVCTSLGENPKSGRPSFEIEKPGRIIVFDFDLRQRVFYDRSTLKLTEEDRKAMKNCVEEELYK